MTSPYRALPPTGKIKIARGSRTIQVHVERHGIERIGQNDIALSGHDDPVGIRAGVVAQPAHRGEMGGIAVQLAIGITHGGVGAGPVSVLRLEVAVVDHPVGLGSADHGVGGLDRAAAPIEVELAAIGTHEFHGRMIDLEQAARVQKHMAANLIAPILPHGEAGDVLIAGQLAGRGAWSAFGNQLQCQIGHDPVAKGI